MIAIIHRNILKHVYKNNYNFVLYLEIDISATWYNTTWTSNLQNWISCSIKYIKFVIPKRPPKVF